MSHVQRREGRRSRGWLWGIAAGALAGQADAQSAGPPPAGATGRVRGVVYDSLARRPLGGALVSVGGRLATADHDGRFAIDSVPAGEHLLGFSHAALDSLGLGTFGRPVTVTAGAETDVRAATPSFATIHRKLCDRAAPGTGNAGIVFGLVRDAETDQRLVGATASVAWLAHTIAGGKLRTHVASIDVPTDSTGTYYACGAETGIALDVQVASGRFASGAIEIAVDSVRRVARQDLYLSLDSTQAAAAADSARQDEPPLPRGTAVLIGTVRDSAGRPLAQATALVAGTAAEGTSNESGGFRLVALPAGSQLLQVRMLGYAAAYVPVRLRARDTTRVDVTLRRATALNTIRVAARRAPGRDRIGFEDRRLRGMGYFITETRLRNVYTFQGAFAQAAGTRVIRGADGGERLVLRRFGRNCAPSMFVDGRRMAPDMFFSLVRVQDIAGVEVYASNMFTPIEFSSASNDCGAVIVWTKLNSRF